MYHDTVLLMSTHHISFDGKKEINYILIITKYVPYFFFWNINFFKEISKLFS